MHLISRHNAVVDDGGRVVACVVSMYRIAHDGLAQVAVGVASADALVDGVFDQITLDVQILSHIDKDNGHARILAHGSTLTARYVNVFDDRVQYVSC